MLNITFGIAVLLSTGLLFAKIVQLFRLPSVTGYILAGLVLGPSGLGILTPESVGHQLDHFTQIALMMLAFGIGEHIELRRLQKIAKDVTYISFVQAFATYLFVLVATWLVAQQVSPATSPRDNFILAMLLGAIAVATAPAALLLVVRELKARGPFTSTLMAVIAIDDGICIMLFGITVSIGHQLIGNSAVTPVMGIMGAVSEIFFSVITGVATGFLLDLVMDKLQRKGEMLTAGLGLLLLCGEVTRELHLSPLLAGMMAGFVIINRAKRDVRLFRVMNNFEPPVYVLFFTLAGVHLNLEALWLAGWVGLAYFIARVAGKYFGSFLGGTLSGASGAVRNYMGLALLPQAGAAIGLVFIVASDSRLGGWSEIITPVVFAGVMVSELIGPSLVRFSLEQAGETRFTKKHHQSLGKSLLKNFSGRSQDCWLPDPWKGAPLHPGENSCGVILFGAKNCSSVRGLARISTLFAHHYQAMPKSVRVLAQERENSLSKKEIEQLFSIEQNETETLGYPLQKELVFSSPEQGLLEAVNKNQTRLLVLGYHVSSKPLAIKKVFTTITDNVSCPVVAIRFADTLSFDRILVPFIALEDLNEMLPVLQTMATTGEPYFNFMHLLYADSTRQELLDAERELQLWRQRNLFDRDNEQIVIAADSRLEKILKTSAHYDLIIIKAAKKVGVRRFFAGSLANSVIQNCRCSVFSVYIPSPEKGEDSRQQSSDCGLLK
ncbi:cation:proton antiporter [Desulforhopalus vacuolatus]|uniref:cation:proton antiporter n=1 Tax=Desulforhopalus vacuolatus TaxID=40414 RepID=UPI0019627A27|nr:cation:proton antiporter [Desulforhopalus vacuolatus]MBM9518732.1 cation:proton antiporter [Desulforhopalus vacuolatus]